MVVLKMYQPIRILKISMTFYLKHRVLTPAESNLGIFQFLFIVCVSNIFSLQLPTRNISFDVSFPRRMASEASQLFRTPFSAKMEVDRGVRCASVTRFGEILPFCQNLQSLGQLFEGLFTIWKNLGPTLANFVCHWASFH